MKAEYDLSKMKSRKNPYASKLKKSVTMHSSRRYFETQLASNVEVVENSFLGSRISYFFGN